jgi:hypothetical protein
MHLDTRFFAPMFKGGVDSFLMAPPPPPLRREGPPPPVLSDALVKESRRDALHIMHVRWVQDCAHFIAEELNVI